METKQKFVNLLPGGLERDEFYRRQLEMKIYESLFTEKGFYKTLSKIEKEIFIDYHINRKTLEEISSQKNSEMNRTKHLLFKAELFVKCRLEDKTKNQEELEKKSEQLTKENESLRARNKVLNYQLGNYELLKQEIKYYKEKEYIFNHNKFKNSIENFEDDFFNEQLYEFQSDYIFRQRILSSRTIYALRENNIYTVKELLNTDENKLRRFRNIGRVSLSEVNNFFKLYGIDYKTKTFFEKIDTSQLS